MAIRRKTGGAQSEALVPVGTTEGVPAPIPTLQALQVVLTPHEEAFAQAFVMCGNATKAFVQATNHVGPRGAARFMAWDMGNRPHVRARVREYEKAAAAATVIDYASILQHDLDIIEGYKHADEIMQHIWQCCRHCYGVDHKYQWRDFEEYTATLQAIVIENLDRERPKPLPDDVGGYGYDPGADPSITCPRCEGRGVGVTVLADTTRLEGPARAIVKGLKVKSDGSVEVLLHDIDKAKERLLRAGGMFGDDAASVARAAAGGAAAGAAIAAKVAENLTEDEVKRLYLELA